MKKSIVLISLLCASFVVSAEEYCPFDLGIQASMEAAPEAIRAKKNGAQKAELLKGLEQNEQSKRVRDLLHDILNEVFDNDLGDLSPEAYAFYRSELCMASAKYEKEVRQIDFKKALPLLQKCNSESDVTRCAMKVVHQISDIPETL